METVKDYSVYIVDLKKRIVDLEKYCLHGVVKNDAKAYRTIKNTVSNMVTTLTHLYEWAAIEELKGRLEKARMKGLNDERSY